MNNLRAFLFDTETTDLLKSKHRPLKDQPHITELFGLTLELHPDSQTWEETGHWHSLFNPGVALNDDVIRITGLTDEELKDKPRFETKAAEIQELIEGHDIIVAHNLSFDQGMIDVEMKRASRTMNWKRLRRLCTVEATEHLAHRRLKLIELHELLFGEGFPNAHRAENDVRPMARCFKALWGHASKGIWG